MKTAIKPSMTEAQELCDRVHAWLQQNDHEYAESVAAGKTKEWTTPKAMGDGTYAVAVSERVIGALNALEAAEAFPPQE